MRKLTTWALLGISTLGLGLSGCQKPEAHKAVTDNNSTEQAVKTISIGYQKSSLNLLVARDEKLLEQQFPRAKIEW